MQAPTLRTGIWNLPERYLRYFVAKVCLEKASSTHITCDYALSIPCKSPEYSHSHSHSHSREYTHSTHRLNRGFVHCCRANRLSEEMARFSSWNKQTKLQCTWWFIYWIGELDYWASGEGSRALLMLTVILTKVLVFNDESTMTL